MVSERPYTPESLASRWECTPQHIRKMLTAGRLRGFKLGEKLWRIAACEVDRIEACQTSSLEDTEESSAPSGRRLEIDNAARSARQIVN